MRRCLILLSLMLASARFSEAQLFPTSTPAGEKARQDLIGRCVALGGLKRIEGGPGARPSVVLGDAAKLKLAVEGARGSLTPALVDTLIARIRGTDGDLQLALIKLLREVGEAAQDRRAGAFASFCESLRDRDSDASLALLEEAEKGFRACGQREQQAACYNQIGLRWMKLGMSAPALEAHKLALENYLAAGGERHRGVVMSHLVIATLHHSQGENAAALEALFKALAIQRVVLGERDFALYSTYNNIAIIHSELGDQVGALDAQLKSLAIILAHPENPEGDLAACYNNIGNFYKDLGNHALALQFQIKALEIRQAALKADNLDAAQRRARELDLADSYDNIGNIHSEMDDQPRALEALRDALKIRLAQLGEQHPAVAATYSNIAAAYKAQGDLAGTLEMSLKTESVLVATLGDRHPLTATSHYNVGDTYQSLGHRDEALRSFDEALKALGVTNQPGEARDLAAVTRHPIVPLVLMARGQLRDVPSAAKAAADLAPALADYRAAAEALDLIREDAALDEDKVRKAEDVSELFPLTVGLLARLAAQSGNDAILKEALIFAERGAARVFLEGMGRSRASGGGRVDPATLADEGRLAAEIREVDARIAEEQEKPDDKRDAAAVERLFLDRKRVEEPLSSLVARMERDFPQYAALKHPRPCSIAEARAALAEDEVALTYVLGNEASYLVVLSPGDDISTGGIAVHKLADAGSIGEMVGKMTRERILGDFTASVERVEAYQMLLAPAASAIAGKRLVIVPGGVLGQLPFELLAEPDGKGEPRFLIQGHSIRYAPSLTALHLIDRWEDDRTEMTQGLWALGDPVYSPGDARMPALAEGPPAAPRVDGRGVEFARLEETGREVDRLAGLMGSGPGERLMGLEANEAAVKRLSSDGTLAKYRYVHFACHGVLGTGEGGKPGLVLAQVGNPEGQDGFLRLDEVANLRLNADLVALSACHTGQGQVTKTEGVSGLARAFLYSGSRGVLCSLWKVEDVATSNLMVGLYEGLKAGKPAADALRSAQLKMIEAGEPPLHWAPFVLIGR